MSKIEPMSVEEIKEELRYWRKFYPTTWHVAPVTQLIYSWIHAEARARHAYHQWNAALKVDHHESMPCSWCDMRFEDWLAAVKKEVEWVED